MTGPIEILYYKAAYPAVSQAVRVRRAGTPAVRVGKHGQPAGWPGQQDGGGTQGAPAVRKPARQRRDPVSYMRVNPTE